MSVQEPVARRKRPGFGLLVWTIFLGGLVWVAVTAGLTYLATQSNDPSIKMIAEQTLQIGYTIGHFLRPILQMALVVFILLTAAERIGFLDEDSSWRLHLGSLSQGNNVQAFIAVAIIGALVVSAVGNVGDTGVLKDLALVVVGFYFGTRRREGEVQDAANAAAERVATTLPPTSG
ncbi:hypothetical protein LB526_01965 [Mesorhizobium sp. CA6]|uniref:hypothetical protein n=1 Tax=Mesorhizobium sp. CA6 TaxID=588500 RepID=UPI001CCD6BBB|nr:hypothetical protein [Mesorhizobium sp. CA6]MBZ9765526.1 hypothetical protein [Mesorhizobium sp. CA6]